MIDILFSRVNGFLIYIVENNKRIILFIVISSLILKITYLFSSVVWISDEYFFSLAGKAIADGKILYRDFFDIKPPGIFIIYALLVKLFGYSNIYLSVKITAIIFQIFEALIFFKITEILFNKRRAFYSTIIFIIALSVDASSWPFNIFTIILLPFGLYLYFFIKDKFVHSHINLFISGLFLGLCALTSTAYIIFLVFLPIQLFFTRASIKDFINKNITYCLGFLIPIFIATAYFFAKDALGDWYWWNITWGGYYSSEIPLLSKLYNTLKGILFSWAWIPLYILCGIGVLDLIKKRKKFPINILAFSITIFLLLMLNRFISGMSTPRYNPYILPIIIIFSNFVSYTKIKKIYLKVMVLLLAVAFVGTNIYYNIYPYDRGRKPTAAVTDWIKNHSDPKEKILVWNEGYHFYSDSQREMACGFYFFNLHLDIPDILNSTKEADIDRLWHKFLYQLETESPVYIIDITGNWSKYNEQFRKGKLKIYMDHLKEYVKENYYIEKDFKGIKYTYKKSSDEFESIKIWKRKQNLTLPLGVCTN